MFYLLVAILMKTLDGLLYNESDLLLEEHYTDTGGYTEINFATFTMLGKTFSPRIKGIQKQRIYKIDKGKDYGDLAVLLKNSKSNIRMEWITEQWDRMGHFYTSLESGYVTASTALKRLIGYTGKNHFYRANCELGRIFKTIRILNYMSDKVTRSNATKGLLKSELRCVNKSGHKTLLTLCSYERRKNINKTSSLRCRIQVEVA